MTTKRNRVVTHAQAMELARQGREVRPEAWQPERRSWLTLAKDGRLMDTAGTFKGRKWGTLLEWHTKWYVRKQPSVAPAPKLPPLLQLLKDNPGKVITNGFCRYQLINGLVMHLGEQRVWQPSLRTLLGEDGQTWRVEEPKPKEWVKCTPSAVRGLHAEGHKVRKGHWLHDFIHEGMYYTGIEAKRDEKSEVLALRELAMSQPGEHWEYLPK